jgi:hypothetical protein
MHDQNVEPVDYQRAESPYATRKSVRLLLILTLLNTIMLGSSLLGPKTWSYVRSVYQQWKDERAAKAAAQAQLQKDIAAQKQAVTFTLPEKTVVYDENWENAAKLLQSGTGYAPALPSDSRRPMQFQVPALQINPQVYKDLTFKMNGGSRYPAAMAFLHERMTPSHHPMLVAVELTSLFRFSFSSNPSAAIVSKGRRLWASAWNLSPNGIEIPTAFTTSMELVLPDSNPTGLMDDSGKIMNKGNELRLFAGVVDPRDDSRFVIPIEVDGKKGEIVGKLTDSGFTLTPSIGKPGFSTGDVIQWKLLDAAGRSTAPATPSRR